ncbi:MAG: hypothetical protein WB555_24175, partial [Candidatus Korobacteraceae bacterium]
ADAVPTTTYANLSSVACPTASECVAVGWYQNSQARTGLLLVGSGNSWNAVETPLPSNSDGTSYLTAVTCPSTTQCVAAGSYYDAPTSLQGLLVTGAGSTWTAAQAPLPSNVDTATVVLNSVACQSASRCVVTGTFDDSSNYSHGLLIDGPS